MHIKDGKVGTVFGMRVLAEVKVEDVGYRISVAQDHVALYLGVERLRRKMEAMGAAGPITIHRDDDPLFCTSSLLATGHRLTPDRQGNFEMIVHGGPFSNARLMLPRLDGSEAVAFAMPNRPHHLWVCPASGGLEGSIYFDQGAEVARDTYDRLRWTMEADIAASRGSRGATTETQQRSAQWAALAREMRLNPAELKVYKETRRELLKRADALMLLRKARR